MIEYRKAVLDDARILSRIRGEFLAQANDTLSDEERNKIEKACIKYFEETLKDKSFVAWLAKDD
jgi:hypothetical protein